MLRVESRLREVIRLSTVNTGEAVSVALGHCLRHLHQLEFFLFLAPLGRQPYKWKVKVAQLCPTLCNYGLYSLWNSPGQNTGMGSLSLLQGILLTQESNSGVPHCGWILYQLSSQYSLIPRQSPARSPGNRLSASWNTLLLLHVVPHLHTAQLGLVHLEISRF